MEEGDRARPVVDRVLGRRICSKNTSRSSSTTTSPPRWKTTSTRSRTARKKSVPWLKRFYFGNGNLGLQDDGAPSHRRDRPPRGQLDPDGQGRRGPRDHRSRRVATAPISSAATIALRSPRTFLRTSCPSRRPRSSSRRPARTVSSASTPRPGLQVFVKTGRYGPYVQLGEMEDGAKEKPKTASLFKDMDPADRRRSRMR